MVDTTFVDFNTPIVATWLNDVNDHIYNASPNVAEGRLTLSASNPVPATQITAATTLYLLPYGGNGISLFNGTQWNIRNFTSTSIALPATTNTNYDVFAYDNAGTVTLELLAWASATARATAISRVSGIYVKSGDTTRKYLGSVRTGAVTGESEDSFSKRFIWNLYNRIPRWLERYETTASWVYTTAAYRQANASTLNQVEFITGLAEDPISSTLFVDSSNASADIKRVIGLGFDSVTAVAGHACSVAGGAGITQTHSLSAVFNPQLGYHYISWLEWSTATGTTTWYGTNNGIEAFLPM